jgi:hypothetical protein
MAATSGHTPVGRACRLPIRVWIGNHEGAMVTAIQWDDMKIVKREGTLERLS